MALIIILRTCFAVDLRVISNVIVYVVGRFIHFNVRFEFWAVHDLIGQIMGSVYSKEWFI